MASSAAGLTNTIAEEFLVPARRRSAFNSSDQFQTFENVNVPRGQLKTAFNKMIVRKALKSGSLKNLVRPQSVAHKRNDLMKVASQKMKMTFEGFKNSPEK